MSTKSVREFGVKVWVEFAAAHHIVGYPGDCANPHGHNYKIEVEATTPSLDQIGLAVDFKVLKRLIKELIAPLDHADLNTLPQFREMNPTAETLARYLFEELETAMVVVPETKTITLRRITVWENDRSAASFGMVS